MPRWNLVPETHSATAIPTLGCHRCHDYPHCTTDRQPRGCDETGGSGLPRRGCRGPECMVWDGNRGMARGMGVTSDENPWHLAVLGVFGSRARHAAELTASIPVIPRGDSHRVER